jgi:hypothetical protein
MYCYRDWGKTRDNSSSSMPIYLRSVSILSSHLRPGNLKNVTYTFIKLIYNSDSSCTSVRLVLGCFFPLFESRMKACVSRIVAPYLGCVCRRIIRRLIKKNSSCWAWHWCRYQLRHVLWTSNHSFLHNTAHRVTTSTEKNTRNFVNNVPAWSSNTVVQKPLIPRPGMDTILWATSVLTNTFLKTHPHVTLH